MSLNAAAAAGVSSEEILLRSNAHQSGPTKSTLKTGYTSSALLYLVCVASTPNLRQIGTYVI